MNSQLRRKSSSHVVTQVCAGDQTINSQIVIMRRPTPEWSFTCKESNIMRTLCKKVKYPLTPTRPSEFLEPVLKMFKIVYRLDLQNVILLSSRSPPDPVQPLLQSQVLSLVSRPMISITGWDMTDAWWVKSAVGHIVSPRKRVDVIEAHSGSHY